MTPEEEVKQLRRAQTNRNIVVSAFALTGIISGFLIARKFKKSLLIKSLLSLGGGLALGLPVYLLTLKKYKQRRTAIRQKMDINVKVSDGKIVLKPNTLTATKEVQIQSIISNIEKANEQAFTKQERPKIEGYFNLLSEEDLTTWVKLSNFLMDDNVITLPENQREKYMKDKYGLDFKKTGEMMMKYMDFVMGVGTKNNTKQA
jgi:hypothetical protein